MATKLKAMKDSEWESTFFALVQLLQNDKEMDPVLKMLFLKRTLDVAVAGSPAFAMAFGSHQKFLAEADVDTAVKWIVPDDADAKKARSAAAAVLLDLPDPAVAATAAATELRKLTQAPRCDYRWIGWLGRSLEGEWECCLAESNLKQQSGQLLIMHTSLSTGKVQITAVGRLNKGEPTIKSSDVTLLLQGRPLFLLKDVSETIDRRNANSSSGAQ